MAWDLRSVGATGAAQWLTFYLGSETFALHVEDVQEVLMEQPLTAVPLAPAQMVGLLNLRGQIMPAIDLRRRLGMAGRGEHAVGKLIIVKTPDGPLGAVVDEIGDVHELRADDWRATPDTVSTVARRFVFAVCRTTAARRRGSSDPLVRGLAVECLGFDAEVTADA